MILAKLDNLQLCDRSSYNNSFNLDLKIVIGIEEKSIGSGPEFAKISKISEAGEKNRENFQAFEFSFFMACIKFCNAGPARPRLPTCSTSSFQKLVEKVQNYINEFWLILKNEFGALILSVFLFFLKKMFYLVKWAKTNAFVDRQDEVNKNAGSFPTYRILAFEV